MVWLALAAAGAVTYALRALPARLAGERPLPAWGQRGLDLLGPAAFAAIAAPAVTSGEGTTAGSPARLAAVTVAVLVARRTGSIPLSVGLGLTALGLLA